MKQQRRFPKEFEDEAVRLVLSGLVPIGRFSGEGYAGRLQWGGGAWDGLRVLRLGGGIRAAGVHRPGLPSVSLPRL